MKIIDAGEGTFLDSEPVEAPEDTPDDPNMHVYAYAHFSSLERVSYGLRRTKGGPEDEEIESVKVSGYSMEPIALFWEFGDAIDVIGSKHAFEETPLVEIENEEDYNQALEALEPVTGRVQVGLRDSQWEKPGLYDFRDDPPTYAGTVEKYELEEMMTAAEEAIDFMFQGDEWEDAYHQLGGEE
jgi:hypothetical protein